MNDIPMSKDRFRRAILCSLSLLGQGRPELRCGTGTVRCLDSAVTLACLLILSTPKITFFLTEPRLPFPRLSFALVRSSVGQCTCPPMRRQQLFSKIFTIVCNLLSRNKMQIHFSRFSAFHRLPPPRRSRFGAQKDNLHPHDHLAADHAQISRYSLFSNAIIETSTTTSDNFSAGVCQTTPHDGCSDKTGRTNRTNRDMKILTGIRFSYGISTFPIFANIIAHPCFRAIQALRKRKMPNLPKNHSRKETRHPPIDPISHPFQQAQSENISKQLAIQTQQLPLRGSSLSLFTIHRLQ